MGNCFIAPWTGEHSGASRNSSHPSKVVSCRTSSSLVLSTRTTDSTASTLTVPSYGEKSRSSSLPTLRTEGEILSASNSKAFAFSELRSATKNFRPESLIGEGGFGFVYKGWLDENSLAASKPGCGMVVAIKKLKPESFQGHKEWLTEVNYLGQLHHPNLVKLIGYCSEGENRLLVYEYMAKGSLENHLFKTSAQPLDWATRISVAIGAARGLAYVHDAESHVIYRDVKASNILLDPDFNAKLSDFGLAKAGPTGSLTHISTEVMGTHGYAAPEYIATGRLTAKADVYSFGVVLLELLTGRRAVDRSKEGSVQDLARWARPWLTENRKLYKIIDPKLEGQYPKKGAHALALVASKCITSEAKLRPSMSEVLAALERLKDIKLAVRPRQANQGKVSITTPRSPLGLHQRSPLHPAPGTPSSCHNKSPLVH